MTSVIPQWIQDLNTGLSFLGFFITVYVLFEVRRIRSSFLTRARLPEMIKDLASAGSALSSSLTQWPGQRNESLSQIKIAAAVLKSTVRVFSGPERKELNRVHVKLIKASRDFSNVRHMSVDIGWDLYSDIQSCLTSLGQVSKNLRWE